MIEFCSQKNLKIAEFSTLFKYFILKIFINYYGIKITMKKPINFFLSTKINLASLQ